MKHKFIFGFIAFILISAAGGAAVLVNHYKKARIGASEDGGVAQNIQVSKPWVEVLKPNVYASVESGEKKSLQTGDEIDSGYTVETDTWGLANIYFPDGSVARLDSGTQIFLEEGEYSDSDQSLKVKISLSAGRVWSKIIELATPDSLWEVKTTNAVATVRGTAFGFEHIDGKSSVVGSENQVELAPIDPDTKEILTDKKVIISPNKIVELKRQDLGEIKSGKIAIADKVKEAGPEVLEKEWVKRAAASDVVLNEKIKEIKQRVEENRGEDINKEELKKEIKQEIRNEIKKDAIKPFIQEIEKRRIEKEESKQKSKDNILENKNIQSEEKKILKPQTEGGQAGTGAGNQGTKESLKPIKLLVRPADFSGEIKEGERITFQAVLIMADNSEKIVTEGVKWQVLGQMGKMERPGVFYAELDSTISEFGEASGAVIAVWESEDGTVNFLAKTKIFKVRARVEETTDTRG
ncbi:MAG: FecR domain-containing protein [Candidatus Pacebacteria bacterium]|nr:FecR domain-containing protein [Candidatus Paceibacterota bacterium]